MPNSATSSIFYFQSLTNSVTDFDYDKFAYPQFHDPLWMELRYVTYNFDVTLLQPGGTEPIEYRQAATVLSFVPMSPAPTDPIAPVLGPPTAPLINGVDAFVPQSGVGVQPIFSWLPPNLGTATSYQLNIYSLSPLQEGDTGSLSAVVYSATTFKVPPGFLKAGNMYRSVITARQAPWDAMNHGPFRAGTPLHTADCVTGIFIP